MSYIGNQVTSNPFIVDVFSGTGSQTVFTGLTFAPAGTASIGVFVAGSYQSPTSYTLSGTTLTFNSAPAAGTNNIQVLHLGVGSTSITVTDGSITSVKIAGSTITGDKIAAATIGSSNLTVTGVSAGSYGDASSIAAFTVDAQGRISAASNVAITIPEAGINALLFTGT